jgi:hypothetical protein
MTASENSNGCAPSAARDYRGSAMIDSNARRAAAMARRPAAAAAGASRIVNG